MESSVLFWSSIASPWACRRWFFVFGILGQQTQAMWMKSIYVIIIRIAIEADTLQTRIVRLRPTASLAYWGTPPSTTSINNALRSVHTDEPSHRADTAMYRPANVESVQHEFSSNLTNAVRYNLDPYSERVRTQVKQS